MAEPEKMTAVQKEIWALEERLRQAELAPDPAFFESALADEALMVSQDGAFFAKSKIVEAHQPGKGPAFTRAEMSDWKIVEQGSAVVVSCTGDYAGSAFTGQLKFMRVWLKKDGRWQIIAGSVFN